MSGCCRPAPGITTLVVRPHPGHALTSGENERKPIVCRISCATITSRVRSPFGSGVSEIADRVADALLQQHGQRGRRRDDPLRAHARFGEAEVQRVIAAPRELGVDGDQVLHVRDLAREDDAVAGQAERFGELRAADRRGDERLAHMCAASSGFADFAFSSIRLASSSWSRLPQLTPMRTGLP